MKRMLSAASVRRGIGGGGCIRSDAVQLAAAVGGECGRGILDWRNIG